MAVKGSLLDERKLKQLAEDYGEGVKEATNRGLERALNLLEAQAVELAPVDTGNLEASTSVRIYKRGDAATVGELTFATPYAHRVHEEGEAGPLTLAKPGNELGPAGRKYLERALRQRVKDLGGIVADEIKGST